jgi:NAD+ kinase
MARPSLAFLASDRPEAQAARAALSSRYGEVPEAEADVVVALGGDGFMLETLHRTLPKQKPIYGMNRGSVGFLMNDYDEAGLLERIGAAEQAVIHPLMMTARDAAGALHEAIAINEVSLLRQTYQTAKLRILIDGKPRLAELFCDGALVSTPAGSTAYNLSVQGPILPLDSGLVALTPISPFRPRRWRGAILSDKAVIEFRVLDPDKRPVSAVADQVEVRDIASVRMAIDRSSVLTLLFDPEHALDDRIVMEQFAF